MNEPYKIRIAGTAKRRIECKPPEAAAAAIIEFITGSLAQSPHRVGKPLRYDLEGNYSARRGDFRILYKISEQRRLVMVLRVEHRADVYRSR